MSYYVISFRLSLHGIFNLSWFFPLIIVVCSFYCYILPLSLNFVLMFLFSIFCFFIYGYVFVILLFVSVYFVLLLFFIYLLFCDNYFICILSTFFSLWVYFFIPLYTVCLFYLCLLIISISIYIYIYIYNLPWLTL